MYPNDSTLQWTKVIIRANEACNTLTLSDKLKEKGIHTIKLDFNDWPDVTVYVHQEGLLFTDMPDSAPHVSYLGSSVPVLHEILQFQKYNGKLCNDSLNYRLDKCRLEYIKKVQTLVVFVNKLIILTLFCNLFCSFRKVSAMLDVELLMDMDLI